MNSNSPQCCTGKRHITEHPFEMDHEIIPCVNPDCPAKK